ncbi:MAG: hypothetical protein GF370_02870 [Candidatus Nealsonbacteria bacterium]|nr:hypothetical protein [Candidatus Nealsonbacteria bacterium]
MDKTLNNFFVVLGIIFLLVIMVIVYFIVIDPLGLRSLLLNKEVNLSISTTTSDREITDDAVPAESTSTPTTSSPSMPAQPVEEQGGHPLLDEEQEAMLETFGIDVDGLPSEITPEMEACFIEKLGEQRVNEIVEGATPTPLDFFRAKSCLDG